MSFDDDIALEAEGAGRFSCAISPNHWLIAGPNGGYLAALLAHAGDAHLGASPRQLRGLTVHYLRPPAAGPALIEVATEQLGRSVAFQRLTMTQGDRTVLLATGSWADRRSNGAEHDAINRPPAPHPDNCTPMAGVRTDGPLPVHRQWDIRSGTNRALGSGPPAELTWWIRPPAHRPLDAPMLAAMCDALPPPLFMVASPLGGVPTIDLTLHTRAQLSEVRWSHGDWVLAHFTTRFAGDGFVEEDGELWTADGTLLAHSRQLALAI